MATKITADDQLTSEIVSNGRLCGWRIMVQERVGEDVVKRSWGGEGRGLRVRGERMDSLRVRG